VSRSQFSNNADGVAALGRSTTGSVFLSLSDTNITNSSGRSVYTSNGTALFSAISLDGVTVSGGGAEGLFADGVHARILVNNSGVIDNIGGVASIRGGTIVSFGNNRVNSNNGNDGAFTSTTTTR